jgi:hypothetical protein
MKYMGDYNTKCGLCQGRVAVESHPVVVRINGEVKKGKLICSNCFKVWSTEHSKLKTEKSIIEFESWLSTQLQGTEFACPAGHEIKGFWFGTFENGPLGLVVNYSSLD